MLQGLEAGLLVGVVLCALHFAYEYSLMQLVSLTVLPSRSHAMLPFRYQQVLALFQDHITAVSVSGVQSLSCLSQHVVLCASLETYCVELLSATNPDCTKHLLRSVDTSYERFS